MQLLRCAIFLLVAASLSACAATAPSSKATHEHSAREDAEFFEAFGYMPTHDHADRAEGEYFDKAAPRNVVASSALPTEEGLFTVLLTPGADNFTVGENSAELTLTDKDGARVEGAAIDLIPWMPLHGHGISARPTAQDMGDGVYRLEGIALPMAGLWELRLTITLGETSDLFNYGPFSTVDIASGGADYIKVNSPAGYNVTLGVKSKPNVLEPVISVDELGRTVKTFNLTVEEINFEIYPGKRVLAWAFNGTVPGPEMRVQEGDVVRVTLTNNVRDTHHTVHIHGIKKDVASDGVPYLGQVPTEYGKSYTYSFVATPSGTSWYHCHVDSAHHVDMGMYGPFIVEEAEPVVEFDREYVWLLDEWPSSQEHMHPTGPGKGDHKIVTHHPGALPKKQDNGAKKRDWYPKTYAPYQPVYDSFLINGRAYPYTTPLETRTGERIKIRVINAGYQAHYMHIHSHKFLVTHRDGRPLATPEELDTVQIGPGQRADLLLVADNPGIWPFHCHSLDHVANDRIYPGGMLTFLRYMDWPVPEDGANEAPDDKEGFFDSLE
jgi:plastocyanin